MSTAHSIQTIIEVLIVYLLLWGFVNEDKVVRIEQHIKRIIKGNYRRYKRNKERKIKWTKTYHQAKGFQTAQSDTCIVHIVKGA